MHAGGQIGSEYNYKSSERSRLYQTLHLSYFYHRHLTQAISLQTDIGYEYRLRMGLSMSALFGLGYMHSFATAAEYLLVDGQYVRKADKGNARLAASLSLEVAYYLRPSQPNSARIFLRYQSWVEYPYSPDFIPLMTHINLHLGFAFFLNRDKNE